MKFPAESSIYESSAAFYEQDEKPEDLSPTEFSYELFRRHGHNLCVCLAYGDGYILFDPPINYSDRYTLCRRQGNQTRQHEPVEMLVTTEGLQILADGLRRVSTEVDNPVRDEWYALYLPSGVCIEFGVEAESRTAIETKSRLPSPRCTIFWGPLSAFR